MERLVLLVIAVIGLHTAFVLYMADVRVDRSTAKVRTAPAAKPAAPVVAEPAVETELQASIPTATVEDPPAPPVTTHDQPSSKTARISSPARLEAGDRRRPRLRETSKPVRAAFARPASPGPKSIQGSFGDRIILYRAASRPPVRSFTPSIAADEPAPKPKKSSLLAKLQLVYKKPWGVIKAIGSKLH
jgi:hypothetical protein